MDSFQKPYWSKLQVELWVCTRSREAVGLAEYAPGRTHFADLSIGPDGLDDEAYDQDTPTFDDEIDLIGTAIVNYGCVCPFEDAQKEVIVALSKGQLQQHQDRSTGVEFFEREEVLRRWHDPRWETLRAKTEPLTLAEAVALLVRGRPASKNAWERLRRRAGSRCPPAAEERIEAAGQAVVGMIRNGMVEAFGFRCHRDGGIGLLNDKERLSDDRAFLAHQLWVDPCADAIWTELALGDGHFNPTDRGYRYVCLNRTQFLDAVRSHDTKPQADSTVNQRIRTIGGAPKRLFGRAAVVRRPEGSVVRVPEAEVPSKSLNTADCAEPPARNYGRQRRKATIPPAPKRGRAHQYDWASFDRAAEDLFRDNPDATQASATRAMTEWAGTEWGGQDGPGEPAISRIRERLAYHPGAPWLALTERQLCVIRELRKEASRTKKRDFSTRDFGSVCARSGVVDPTTPKSSQRRLKSDLKKQLANKGLITVVDGMIQLASPKNRPST